MLKFPTQMKKKLCLLEDFLIFFFQNKLITTWRINLIYKKKCFWFVNKIMQVLHFYHCWLFSENLLVSFSSIYIMFLYIHIWNPQKLGGKLEKRIELLQSPLLPSFESNMYRKGGCEMLVNRVGMPLYRKLAFSRKVTIVVLISQDTTSPAGLTSRF